MRTLRATACVRGRSGPFQHSLPNTCMRIGGVHISTEDMDKKPRKRQHSAVDRNALEQTTTCEHNSIDGHGDHSQPRTSQQRALSGRRLRSLVQPRTQLARRQGVQAMYVTLRGIGPHRFSTNSHPPHELKQRFTSDCGVWFWLASVALISSPPLAEPPPDIFGS